MKILIAEDDTVSRHFLERILQKLGYIVTTSRNGKEAWEAYQTSDFPVVISDWMMPEMDGVELCRRIRRYTKAHHCHFMILTARTSKADFLEAMEAGADDYLTKPLDPDEIEVRLRMAERALRLQWGRGENARIFGVIKSRDSFG